ncbi:ORF6N domain-containing protein [Metaclostridioides mangenotii]
MTTELLAEAYGTDVNNIKNNFNRNKDNFEEEKHYYLLQIEIL